MNEIVARPELVDLADEVPFLPDMHNFVCKAPGVGKNSLDLKLVRSSESRVTFCAAMCCMSPGPNGVWMLQTGHN